MARMSALERAGEEERQGYHDSPDSGIRQPPKRSGSLSSGSHLGAIAAAGLEDESSPQTNSNGDYSSPEGVGSGQSEQLAFFKDYYSQDEIRPGDKVAVLWAYQPRANDEFELERGDMLKVVGIWDDGWATGVRLLESAEEWEDDRHNPQRDSGMSNGSSRSRDSPTGGEIKAFPVSLKLSLFLAAVIVYLTLIARLRLPTATLAKDDRRGICRGYGSIWRLRQTPESITAISAEEAITLTKSRAHTLAFTHYGGFYEIRAAFFPLHTLIPYQLIRYDFSSSKRRD